MLKNYQDESADSIGGVILDWSLTITNYKDKKTATHETSLTLESRAVTYDNTDILEEHINYLKHPNYSLSGTIYNTVKIYNKLPLASYDVFYSGIPELNTGSGTIEALILYTADLDEVGIIDNSTSNADCSYFISLTTGFTNSESLSLGEELYMEAGCDIFKVGVKISMNATFTKESSQSHTETITYNVPAKTMAYLYQGFIQCAILSMNLASGELKYAGKGKYLTNFFKTSPTPLLSLS